MLGRWLIGVAVMAGHGLLAAPSAHADALPLPAGWERAAGTPQILGDFDGNGTADAARILTRQGKDKLWVSLQPLGDGLVRHMAVLDLDDGASASLSYLRGSGRNAGLEVRAGGRRLSLWWDGDRFALRPVTTP